MENKNIIYVKLNSNKFSVEQVEKVVGHIRSENRGSNVYAIAVDNDADSGIFYASEPNKINVEVINNSKHELPKYETSQSAGMDIRANIDEPVTLQPLERHLFPTGIKIALPVGYECQVRPRSGLALKHGISVLNTPGTVDSDYRGEIGVVLINLSNEPFVVNDGDRIAQLVFSKHEKCEFNLVETLDETERGEGGYGHTGK